MELSSRQLVALGGPLLIGYLTWSAVSGGVAAQKAALSVVTGAASVSKRPEVATLTRDPFARGGAGASAIEAAGGEVQLEESPLHLDGTVVAGRWRLAIINGARVFEGQTFRGMRLATVTSNGVTLVSSTGEDVRLALEIAPAAPLAKAPGAPAAATTPLQRGMDALKSGAGADVLKSLGIPES